MTRLGKVMAVLMVICLSFFVLLIYGVLPKEKIKDLASPAIENLKQLALWLEVKVRFMVALIIQKFFTSIS